MQPRPSFGILFVVVLSFLGLPEQADADLYQNTGFEVGSDFNSGSAFGVAYGTNAVPTSMSSSISYVVTAGGEVVLYSNLTVKGIWGNPNDYNSPYYSWLEQNGLHTNNSFQLAEFEWDGKWYQFNELVGLTQQGHTSIAFNSDYTSLTGFFTSNVSGQGAIPVNAYGSVQIFEPGHPFEFDWMVSLNSKWVTTTEYHQIVPSPAGMTLLGIAGLVGRRRRR